MNLWSETILKKGSQEIILKISKRESKLRIRGDEESFEGALAWFAVAL